MPGEKIEIENFYSRDEAEQWAETKTMEHASGIWGREPMLQYLRSEIIKPGDKVVDLGCGAGYVSAKIAEMTGDEGSVIGIDLSGAQLGLEEGQIPVSKKYEDKKNLHFINGDVREIPIRAGKIDKVVSFMVLHNLDMQDVERTFQETARILKNGGQAVFLTMHPLVLESDWDLDFWIYDKHDIEKYKEASDKEGIILRGVVKNVSGGEKPVFIVNHTKENMQTAIERAGLELIREQDLYIDEKNAKEKFGEQSVGRISAKPAYWIVTLRKSK